MLRGLGCSYWKNTNNVFELKEVIKVSLQEISESSAFHTYSNYCEHDAVWLRKPAEFLAVICQRRGFGSKEVFLTDISCI